MRINPIYDAGYSNSYKLNFTKNVTNFGNLQNYSNMQFSSGQHEAAKYWGEVFGSLGFITSAIAYMTTGGAATIPMLFGYDAIKPEINTNKIE